MRKRKEILEEAIMMPVAFSIPQFPQNTGWPVFDSGKKELKQESKIVVTTVI